MELKHKEKLDKLKIAISAYNNKWETIANKVDDLRRNIKEEVIRYVNPVGNIQDEKSNIL